MVDIEWLILQSNAIKRLNICDGAIVHPEYIDSIDFIGKISYDILNKIYNQDEINTMTWIWKIKKLNYSTHIYIFKMNVTHHLRFSDITGFHYETWLLGLFECNDGVFRLAPLKRVADCNFDIMSYLKEHANIDVIKVWSK